MGMPAGIIQAVSAVAQPIRPGHYGTLPIAEQVRWSEEETWRASKRRDAVTLRLLLHNNYFCIGTTGPKLKEKTIACWAARAGRPWR